MTIPAINRIWRTIETPIASYGFKKECFAEVSRRYDGWWVCRMTHGMAPGMRLVGWTRSKDAARTWWKAIRKGRHILIPEET